MMLFPLTYNAFEFESFTNTVNEDPKRIEKFKAKLGNKIKRDYECPNEQKLEIANITKREEKERGAGG